jgi:alkylation response protein AidB-like acyl-CoA dehydrogenase
MTLGTDEQKERILPGILRGEVHFSIGYTEPTAGTDLASLRTRAVRDGDEYVITGEKLYTSAIQYADYVWLAARTDPDAPKHKGLSVFIVPTDAPGFHWTPLRTVAGEFTSATFYDEVRVPASNLVGGENQGWKLITNQLNHERVALCPVSGILRSIADVAAWAREEKLADGSRVIDREWVQVHLARVQARAELLKLLNWKVAWAADKGLNPADASATKVFGTEFALEAYRLLLEIVGQAGYLPEGSPGAVLSGRLEHRSRSETIFTFGGGTNEVQRTRPRRTPSNLRSVDPERPVTKEASVDDHEIIARIGSLAEEEQHLEERHVGEGLSDEETARLKSIEVTLDRMWDLLRQRRALRDAGKSPEDAALRTEGTVEGYRQ